MSKLTSPAGDMAAQRDADASRFFGRKIKNAGKIAEGVFTPMNKPSLAQTGAQIGTLPSGANTVGGVVGGLSAKSDYQGKKSGTR